MSFLGDLLGGGGGNSSESISNLNDQRSAVGEGGMLVRDRGQLTINHSDGGAIRGGLKLAGKALDSVALAWADAKETDDESRQVMLWAMAAVAAVAVAAVMAKGR